MPLSVSQILYRRKSGLGSLIDGFCHLQQAARGITGGKDTGYIGCRVFVDFDIATFCHHSHFSRKVRAAGRP